MPSVHIDEGRWRKIEKKTVDLVIASKTSVKESTVLKILIDKGISQLSEEDLKKYSK